MQLDRRESARVDERNPRSVRQLDGCAREAWERVLGPSDLPIAGHAEVDMEHPVIVELEQLMLTASSDTDDAGTAHRTKPVRRHQATECRMYQRDALDGLVHSRLAEDACSAFNLG